MASLSGTAPRERMRLFSLLCFASGAFVPHALVLALTIHLPRYFAGHVGIGLAAVGMAFTIVRLIDIGFDPMIGAVMDQTKTRIGRYRFWMVAGAPVLMGASYMLFMAPAGASMTYLVIWLLAFYAGISILQLAHSAWAGTLSGDYNERSRIFSFIGAAGLLGAALVMLVPAITARWIGGDDVAELRAMGWAMIALTPVLTLLTIRTPETLRPPAGQTRITGKEYLSLVWRPSMRRIVLADLALALGPGSLTPIFMFYWRDARGVSMPIANLMLVMFMLGGLVGAPIWGKVAQKIGKHPTVIVTSLGFAVGQLITVSLPKGTLLVLPAQFTLGFFVGAFTLLVRAIVADISDEVRLDYGRERSGLLYALVTSTQKVGGAVSVALTFWLLAWLGYDPKAGSANGQEHLHGLEMLYAFVPVAFVVLGALCFIRFPLDARKHADIRAALDLRDATEAAESTVGIAPAGAAPAT